MPLDYFVWAIVGTKRSFIFDTGFDVARAAKRDRTLLRPVGEGLRMIGLDPDKVEDVIISHMHFDHSGNHALFPNARYHVQDAEMKYCTGRCMCHHALRRNSSPVASRFMMALPSLPPTSRFTKSVDTQKDCRLCGL